MLERNIGEKKSKIGSGLAKIVHSKIKPSSFNTQKKTASGEHKL